MARRPDGGWSLGMVNLSGLGPDTSISQWQPPTTLNVTCQATPLAGQGAVTLKVFRSDATHRFVAAGQMTMTKVTLTLVLKPRELGFVCGQLSFNLGNRTLNPRSVGCSRE